eukprot:COSAG06_NODE_2996_length_5981_cov_2.101836_3_plen_38_part_00
MCEASSRAPTRSIEQAAPNPSVYSRPPRLQLAAVQIQ